MKELAVNLFSEPIGKLVQNKKGTFGFHYNSSSRYALSVGLPLQQEKYLYKDCQGYFEGLLPESDLVRTLLGKKYGVSSHNVFSLLNVIGHDCAGAVSFHSPEEEIDQQNNYPVEGRVLGEAEFKELILNLPKRPLFTDIDGMRLSLAGVQDKAALICKENQFLIPHGNCPTTHIIKTSIPNVSCSIFNEFACLKIAHSINLPVVNVWIHQLDNVEVLVIERYDRQWSKGKISRLHQEDFCQALRIIPSKKYENEGGPNLKQSFDCVSYSIFTAKDRINFLKYVIFNIFIGNKDAHGKNFSLRYTADYHVTLAPLYDVLCTGIYSNLTQRMAMKIGGKYLLNDIYKRHYQKLCSDLSVSFPQFTSLMRGMAAEITKVLDQPSFEIRTQDQEFWQKFSCYIRNNIDDVLMKLDFS